MLYFCTRELFRFQVFQIQATIFIHSPGEKISLKLFHVFGTFFGKISVFQKNSFLAKFQKNSSKNFREISEYFQFSFNNFSVLAEKFIFRNFNKFSTLLLKYSKNIIGIIIGIISAKFFDQRIFVKMHIF